MNFLVAALMLFASADVAVVQKGTLYDSSLVVTNVNEAAFVKWGDTATAKTLTLNGSSAAQGVISLNGSKLAVDGTAAKQGAVVLAPRTGSSQGSYISLGSGTGIYFPSTEDMPNASAYGLTGFESFDQRLARKFSGLFYLTTDSSGNKTAATVGTRAAGHAVGPSSIEVGTGWASASYSSSFGNSGADGTYAFAAGSLSEATGDASAAFGYRASATNATSFVWQGSSGSYAEAKYRSKGNGTFCVNPAGGTSGFYVGDRNLGAIVEDAKSYVDSQTSKKWTVMARGDEFWAITED